MALVKLKDIDWSEVASGLDANGWARLGPLVTPSDRKVFMTLYDKEDPFCSHIKMQRHGFGQGEYKYFGYPLPSLVAELRQDLYPPLAAIANDWAMRLGQEQRWPDAHRELLNECEALGQKRPTPLLLRYGAGDYNCLHQDIYGDLTFPLQVVILLSNPNDFSGGEFVLTEQRPRMQSRVEVVPLLPGDAVVFAVNERPKAGKRGYYRVKQRHGVSKVRSGERFAMGLIFHDAR